MNKRIVATSIFLFLALTVSFLTPHDGFAATINVSSGQSIQSAVNNASSGDIITIQAGTYPERVQITKSNLTIQAQGVVNMKGFQISADNVSIKGFTITNLDKDATGILVTSGGYCVIENNRFEYNTWGGVDLVASSGNLSATHDCIVRNNVFYRNGQWGIMVKGKNHLIENNDISNSVQHHPCDTSHSSSDSTLDADGIRFFGTGHMVRGNKIYDILYGPDGWTQGTNCNLSNLLNLNNDYNYDPHIDCFQTWDWGMPTNNIIFEKNYCSNMKALNNGNGGAIGKGFMLEKTTNPNNIIIRNNIIRAYYGIFAATSPGFQAYNNTFTNNLSQLTSQDWTTGIYLSGSPNATIKNNIFADFTMDPIRVADSGSSTGLVGTNNIFYRSDNKVVTFPYVTYTDPKFVSFSNGDLHLQSSSPAIDKGVSISGIVDDIEGKSRPQGLAFDIGVYEYGGTVSAPTIAPTPVVKLGDANNDGQVNDTDYSIWLSNYNKTVSGVTNGDFNNNGKVDGVDYVIWRNNYGK